MKGYHRRFSGPSWPASGATSRSRISRSSGNTRPITTEDAQLLGADGRHMVSAGAGRAAACRVSQVEAHGRRIRLVPWLTTRFPSASAARGRPTTSSAPSARSPPVTGADPSGRRNAGAGGHAATVAAVTAPGYHEAASEETGAAQEEVAPHGNTKSPCVKAATGRRTTLSARSATS